MLMTVESTEWVHFTIVKMLEENNSMQAAALNTIAELYENARDDNECSYDMRCVARQTLAMCNGVK